MCVLCVYCRVYKRFSTGVIKNCRTAMTDHGAIELARIEFKSSCNPFNIISEWLEESKQCGKVNVTFFNLATSSRNGTVTNRTLVLREFKDNSFIFTTNGNSRKIQQIIDNPRVAACFFWSYPKDGKLINRQVKVEGVAEKLPREECEKYYDSEPLYCKIRSHLCQQGEKVDWDELEAKMRKLVLDVKEKKVELKMPEYQVAYRIVPEFVDFYYSWSNSIGDRVVFTKCGDQWNFERVAV